VKERKSTEGPENSLIFRGLILATTLLYTGMCCFFFKTHLLYVLLYVAIIYGGSYFSYQQRNEEARPWINWFVATAVLAAAANMFRELISQVHDPLDILAALIHFLLFVYTLLSFELKRRSDFKFAIIFPVVLLCLTAVVARGYSFGVFVFFYVCIWTVVSYFDCLSNENRGWRKRNDPADKNVAVRISAAGAGAGSAALTLCMLPALSVLVFLSMPRMENVVDLIFASCQRLTRPDLNQEYQKRHSNTSQRVKYIPEVDPRFRQQLANISGQVARPSNVFGKGAEQKSGGRRITPTVAAMDSMPDDKGASYRKQSEKAGSQERVANKAQATSSLSSFQGSAHKNGKTGKAKSNSEDNQPKLSLVGIAGKIEPNIIASANIDQTAPIGKQIGGKSTVFGTEYGDNKKFSSRANRHEGNATAEDNEKMTTGSRRGGTEASGVGGESELGSRTGSFESEGGEEHKDLQLSSAANSGGMDASKTGHSEQGGGSTSGDNTNKAVASTGLNRSSGRMAGSGTSQSSNPQNTVDNLLLSVVSSRAVYLRFQCFDSFDGLTWFSTSSADDQSVVGKATEADSKSSAKKSAPGTPSSPAQGTVQNPAQGGAQNSVKNASPYSFSMWGQPSQEQNRAATPNGPLNNSPFSQLSSSTVVSPSYSVKTTIEEVSPGPRLGKRTFEKISGGRFELSKAEVLKPPPAFTGVDIPMSFRIEQNRFGSSLPSAWIPREAACARANKITVDQFGLLSSDVEMGKGAMYSILTRMPIYDLNSMRKGHLLSGTDEDEIRADHKQYLEIPRSISPRVGMLVDGLIKPDENWFLQAEHIVRFLRANYALAKVDRISFATNDAVGDFLLTERNGTDRMFTSAMTIMCRWAGIPARFVYGLSPGYVNLITGAREVHAGDYRCWTEVFIPEYGWVPFDPVPGGFLPAQTPETSMNPVQTKVRQTLEAKTGISASELVSRVMWWTAAVCIVLIVVALLPVANALFTAWRRSRELLRRYGSAYPLYRKVIKDLQVLKFTIKSSFTPTEIWQSVKKDATAGNVILLSPDLPELVEKFMKSYLTVVFGQRPGTEELLALQTAIHARCRVKSKQEKSNKQ
jgi:hypothetical protein